MLDHQHRAPGRDAPDQLDDDVHVLAAHALCRLVEQHQRRLQRQCGRQFEGTFAPVRHLHGQYAGIGLQADFA
ncbi:hypothetical protein D3C84_1109760 [compost metagenome]